MRIKVVISVENEKYGEPDESAEGTFYVSSDIKQASTALQFATECLKPSLIQVNNSMNRKIKEAMKNASANEGTPNTSGK